MFSTHLNVIFSIQFAFAYFFLLFDFQIVSVTNNTECARLLEEIKCAQCSPHAQYLFHLPDRQGAADNELAFPMLCGDYCKQLYFACRSQIAGNKGNRTYVWMSSQIIHILIYFNIWWIKVGGIRCRLMVLWYAYCNERGWSWAPLNKTKADWKVITSELLADAAATLFGDAVTFRKGCCHPTVSLLTIKCSVYNTVLHCCNSWSNPLSFYFNKYTIANASFCIEYLWQKLVLLQQDMYF